MPQAITDLIITLVGGFILTGIGAICLRFDIHPKIEIKYRPGPMQSSQGGSGKLKCKWYGVLTLYNPTAYTAYAIQFLLPENWTLPQLEINPPHLAGGETREMGFDVVREFERCKVQPHEHETPQPDFNPPHVEPLRDLYPSELRQFVLCAKYSNGHWLRMYSRFSRKDDQQECTHHRFRPKT